MSWSHYRLLMQVEDPVAREWYMREAVDQHWSTRQLDRQISVLYYERLLASRKKVPVRKEAQDKIAAIEPEQFIRDPYVLEFLDLQDYPALRESAVEQAIIDNLQTFLLDLGKGFSFVARQKRMRFEDEDFSVDLVFYHYLYFYGDGFGKDYQILNLDEGTQQNHLELYLVACLRSFFQQQRLYREHDATFRPFNIEKPLWIFVGGSVTATLATRDASDIVEILQFLARYVADRAGSIQRIERVLNQGLVTATGRNLFARRFKAERGWYNLNLTRHGIAALLADKSWYRLQIPAEELAFDSFQRVRLWEEIAVSLLKKYTERYYTFRKARAPLGGIHVRLVASKERMN